MSFRCLCAVAVLSSLFISLSGCVLSMYCTQYHPQALDPTRGSEDIIIVNGKGTTMPSLPIPVSGLPRAAEHPAPSPSAVMRPSPLRSRPRSSGRRPRAYRYAPLRPVLAAPAAPFSPPNGPRLRPPAAPPRSHPSNIYPPRHFRLSPGVARETGERWCLTW